MAWPPLGSFPSFDTLVKTWQHFSDCNDRGVRTSRLLLSSWQNMVGSHCLHYTSAYTPGYLVCMWGTHIPAKKLLMYSVWRQKLCPAATLSHGWMCTQHLVGVLKGFIMSTLNLVHTTERALSMSSFTVPLKRLHCPELVSECFISAPNTSF